MKRTKRDLDKIGKRILSILQEDSRRSLLTHISLRSLHFKLDQDRIGKSVSSIICVRIGGEV